jgi:hypothetical protein
MMSVEEYVELWTWEIEVIEENVRHCRLILHKFHIQCARTRVAAVGDRQITALATAWLVHFR